MLVTIVDYGSGNLRSAAKAMARVARENAIDLEPRVSGRAADVAKADRIVLPGVGAFADCRAGLDRLDGMVDALNAAVLGRGRPFLGICVGMQLMAREGLENGRHAGLGWLDGQVRAIEVDATARDATTFGRPKVPHMGWNELQPRAAHPVLDGLDARGGGAHVYFVHGYHMVCADDALVLATTDYYGRLAAMVGRDNMVGAQFHPEKSQAAGLRLLANFLRWRP